MTFRSALATLTVAVALAFSVTPAHAQAWLPPQGEGSVSFLFSDVLVNNHFFGTQPVDAGRIRSETIVGDVTYGVTDRIAINLSIPVVSSKFTGDSLSPFAAPHPQPLYPGVNPLDDGRYHGEVDHFWPEILPGGHAVLFTIVSAGSINTAQVAVLDLTTGVRKILIRGATHASSAEKRHERVTTELPPSDIVIEAASRRRAADELDEL